MKVLKFGGSSVANCNNIIQSISIIKEKAGKKIVVVSALGGVTDALVDLINKAKSNDNSYKTVLLEIKQRHLETVNDLLPKENQDGIKIILTMRQSVSSLLKAVIWWGIFWNTQIFILWRIASSKLFWKNSRYQTLQSLCDSREFIKKTDGILEMRL